MVSFLDGGELSSDEYHNLLRKTITKKFPKRYRMGMEHIAHWMLMDQLEVKYSTVMGPGDSDASRIHIPEGVEITGDAIRKAASVYREIIGGKLEAADEQE